MKKLTSLLPKLLLLLILTTFFGAAFLGNVEAVSTWQKYPGNPIAGPLDSWGNAYNPTVIFRDNFFKLWFEGNRGSGSMIGYSYSPNGINNWTTINSPILQRGSNNGWESETANANVTFNKQSNIYQMWYTSLNVSHWNYGLDRFRLRYATSFDGINWDRQNGWSSTIGADAWASNTSWDKGGIARGISVLFKDGVYHLWYAGTNDGNLAINPYWRIGYATSLDGVNWIKQNNGNPVIVPTESWELNNVSYPNVLYENGKYKMWYAAGLGDSGNQIVYATSVDGITWDKPENENPVLTTSTSGFDSGNIISPFVMRDGNIYKMWYSGFGNTGSGYTWRIGYATKSAETKLDVPLLKQTSDPWESQVYDSANIWSPDETRIYRWGCALTSAAMILKYYGINKIDENTELNPGTLNTWLINQPDGYVKTGWVNWLAISRLSKKTTKVNNITTFDALEFSKKWTTESAKLKNDLNNSIPDILEEPGHFIVAKGINGETFNINDPYYDRQTLNDGYSNSFLSLAKYTPSKTDLSYIMLVTDINTKISVSSSSGDFVGDEFLEQPIVDPISGVKNSPNPIKIIYVPKPESGDYRINISSDNDQIYNLGIYLYDIDGEVNKLNESGIIGPSNPENIIIHFDKQQSNNSGVERVKDITFQTLLNDIEYLYKLNIIDSDYYSNFNAKARNSKGAYERKNKNAYLNILHAFENSLNDAKENGIDEKAYQILLYDVTYLKTHL